MSSNRRSLWGLLGPLSLVLCLVFAATACSTTSSAEGAAGEDSTAGSLTQEAGTTTTVAFEDSKIVPVTRSPTLGGLSSKVTIVVFSDFQCPYCSRGADTVKRVFEAYPEDVKVVFKQLPLPMHPQAQLAARASVAASNQGKFWEMHDLLFANQQAFRGHANDFEDWVAGFATKLGLNEKEFRNDYHAPATTQIIERDMALSQELGVRGTPHFFVNGKRVRGAKPFAEFAKIVEAQRAQADAVIDGGETPPDLYATLVAKNREQELSQVPSPAIKQPKAAGAPAEKVVRVDTSALTIQPGQVRGPKDAKVTIFAFEDFQCPFCAKADVNLKAALTQVDDSVRVVFKHLPLAFHKHARPAARAAIAAREQGKFWQMHDLLFARQGDLANDGIYVELAESLDLDVKKFKADMADDKYDTQIANDMAQAQELGFRGTPTFVIDGTVVVGAQPAAKFENVIREALSQKQ